MPTRLLIEKTWNRLFSWQIFIFLFVSLSPFYSLAQTLTVQGKVLDAKSFEEIPYVNISVSGTMLGTMSDIKGNFTLPLPSRPEYKVDFSCLGYEPQSSIVKADTNITVMLNPTSVEVEEITVKPDDTAYTIIKRTVENKPEYTLDNCSAQEFELYTKGLIIFRKFNFKKDSSLNTRLFKKEFAQFAVVSEDDKVPGIPGYMIESLSKVYALKSPERVRRDVLSLNIEGTVFNQTEMLDELINNQFDINFYNNQVQLFDKTFISPLASSGKSFYKYALADTVFIDGEKCIEIYFFPKLKENLCFSGSLWVTDSTYVPRRISAHTSVKTDINFIENIHLHQDFDLIGKISAPTELRIGITALNLLINVLSVKDNYILSEPKQTAFYTEEYEPVQKEPDRTVLENKREEYFSEFDRLALNNLNELSGNPKIKAFSKLVEMSITGFYKTKYLDFGPWLLLYSSNPIEGSRLRLGANTTVGLSPKISVDGYLAYGFKDEKFKGALNALYFFNKNRWGLMGFRYGSDLLNIGTQSPFEQQDAFFALTTAINTAVNVNHTELKSLYGQIDVLQRFTVKASFNISDYKPVGEDFVFAWFIDDEKTEIASDYSSAEIKSTLQFHPGNNFVVDGNRRFLTGNNSSPVVDLTYTKGIKGLMGGDFDYDKVSLSLQQKVFTTGLGWLSYLAVYEQTFGQAVYPLLNVLPGNESIWRSFKQFNLIDNGTIVADKLFSARAEWHFDGSITRKIPLVRLLDVRLLAGGNIALGSFDESKNGFYDPENNPDGILSAFDSSGRPASSFQPLIKDQPYSEVFCGVENILKIIRVDFIWRVNSFYKNYTSEFGVKISGRFGL